MSPVHDYTPIPFPNSVPEHLAKAVSEAGEEEVVFDPKIHLQLEPPEFLVTLDFEKVPFPLPKEKAKQLAYSTPFRLLSDEGIRVMHDIVMKNVKHSSSDERIACKIRGLGYLSKFPDDRYRPGIIRHKFRPELYAFPESASFRAFTDEREVVGVACWLFVPQEEPSIVSLFVNGLYKAFFYGPPNKYRIGLKILFTLDEKRHKIMQDVSEYQHLCTLVVDTDSQGMGTGTMLLRQANKAADDKGVPSYLETANVRAKALYERNGYVVAEEWMEEDAPPFWLMRREPQKQ